MRAFDSLFWPLFHVCSGCCLPWRPLLGSYRGEETCAERHSDAAFQVASYTVVIWYNAPLANGKKRVPGH